MDFTARDYSTIRRDLLSRASRVLPEWTDRDPSDFGMLLVDLWAYVGDSLHYYIDRAAGEAYLPTATQRESVLAFANLLDYTPQGRTSATGSCSVQNLSGSSFALPQYTEFVAKVGNTTYTAYATSPATVGVIAETVLVAEGQPFVNETLTSSASGEPGQRYTLPREKVAPDSVRVFVYENGVDPIEYTQVPRITSSPNGDRVFSTIVDANRELQVVFGSTLNGYVPPTGALIKATYVVSSGAAGNLPSNSIVTIKYGSPAGVFVDTSTTLSGGVDEESIESMKTSIPSVISAQNRAVTKRDFVAMTNMIAGVSKTAVQFTQGSGTADSTVTLYAQPNRSADYLTTADTSQTVSLTLRNQVVASVQPKALLGVNVVAATTIPWQKINLTVTVNVNERSVSNFVKRDVEAAIDRLFAFDNVFFGQRIPIGQIYRLLLNVPGVDYITISIFDQGVATGKQEFLLMGDWTLPKKGTIVLNMVGGVTTS